MEGRKNVEINRMRRSSGKTQTDGELGCEMNHLVYIDMSMEESHELGNYNVHNLRHVRQHMLSPYSPGVL